MEHNISSDKDEDAQTQNKTINEPIDLRKTIRSKSVIQKQKSPSIPEPEPETKVVLEVVPETKETEVVKHPPIRRIGKFFYI